LQQDIQDIIKGCTRNELSGQEQLYRLHHTEMIRVCIRYVQHSEDANALYNAAMLKVFKQLPAYEHQGNFQGWLRKRDFGEISMQPESHINRNSRTSRSSRKRATRVHLRHTPQRVDVITL
jgi:hypothetical protein